VNLALPFVAFSEPVSCAVRTLPLPPSSTFPLREVTASGPVWRRSGCSMWDSIDVPRDGQDITLDAPWSVWRQRARGGDGPVTASQ
jgi:hypothetical protein